MNKNRNYGIARAFKLPSFTALPCQLPALAQALQAVGIVTGFGLQLPCIGGIVNAAQRPSAVLILQGIWMFFNQFHFWKKEFFYELDDQRSSS